MRRYLYLLLLLVLVGCRSFPSETACDECRKKLETIQPGSLSSSVSARNARVDCFRQAQGVALALPTKFLACDRLALELKEQIEADVKALRAKQQEVEGLQKRKDDQTSGQQQFLEDELSQIKAALGAEESYVNVPLPAPEPAKQTADNDEKNSSDKRVPICKCNDALTHIEEGLTLSPGESGFTATRADLSNCLKDLRQEASSHYLKDDSECHTEPCDKQVDAVEKLVVAETKSLIAQRDSLAKEIATRRKDDETQPLRYLDAVKDALTKLEPLVSIAGNDVTIKEGDFQARRKAHEAKHADIVQEKTCVDRYAFLDVPSEPDPKGLMDCVDRVRLVCRKTPINEKSCADIVTLSVNECELNLTRLEQKLREYAGGQLDQLNKLKAAHDSLSADDKKKNDDEQKAITDRLTEVRKREIIPDEGDITEYSDYKQWWSKLSLGYEYVSLNHAFTKGFPRMGATIGLNLPRQAVPDVSSHNWHPLSYGVFSTTTLGLTNTGEESKTQFTAPAGSENVKNALAVEEQIFLPWWRSDLDPQDRRLRTWIGPILTAGGRKTDEDTFLSPRFYGGFRLARSPEMYSDWMYGRSGDLRSHRMEVRGQYPLFRFENRSRLVLGGIGNFGVNQRKHQALCNPDKSGHQARTCDEVDSIRFYVTYDVSAETLKKIFGGEK